MTPEERIIRTGLIAWELAELRLMGCKIPHGVRTSEVVALAKRQADRRCRTRLWLLPIARVVCDAIAAE